MKFFTSTKLSDNMRETPEGYLVCLNVPIARTGEMVYMRGELPEIEADNEGKILVSRDASEVFRPETIASFEGKSLTLWHPKEFVAPGNWSVVTKGILQNVRRGTGANETDLLADLLVTDKRAIELIKGGLREVSCGYEADYIQTGVGRAIQKNIIGNHLAMVDEGRAGTAYAIMDHKGKGSPMTLSQKIKAMFEETQDKALKLVAEGDTETPAPVKTVDAAALESVVKTLTALTEKVEALSVPKKKVKDASTQPTQSQPAMVVAADEEVAGSLEDRLKKVEAMLAKLMEGMASTDEESEEKPKKKEKGEDEDGEEAEESEDEDGEEAEESEDADGEEAEESEDEDGEESEDADVEVAATADSKSRIEILAPGMRASGRDAKAKALKVCYATKDGKSVIEKFTGGKAPNFKDDGFVNMVFVAASEILKHTRSEDFSKTKTRDAVTLASLAFKPKGAMTAEALNKKMADHYSGKH